MSDPTVSGKSDVSGISFNGIEATNQQRQASVFRYRRPDAMKTTHGMSPLARSDILFSAVQTISKGGENSLHSHGAMDGFWFVLNGRARFYGEGDQLIAEVGKYEGVFVPRTVPYWFESVGDELLELLQVEAIDKTVKNTLTRHAPRKLSKIELFSQEGATLGVNNAE
jgi:mannose-6-phosphate isomerase-like protein (cupin superfamily)